MIFRPACPRSTKGLVLPHVVRGTRANSLRTAKARSQSVRARCCWSVDLFACVIQFRSRTLSLESLCLGCDSMPAGSSSKQVYATEQRDIMDLIIRNLVDNKDTHYQYHDIESLGSQPPVKINRELVFMTSNENKVRELGEHLKSKYLKLSVADLDLNEIQHLQVLDIAAAKCRQAFAEINRSRPNQPKCSVLVEDCSLNFAALNGMPGPYVKWFVDAIGPEGLHKMLAGFESKEAEAHCVYALMDDEHRIVFCRGVARGRITNPRGEDWAWGPIFEEQTTGLTFGEMNAELKDRYSHRGNAIRVLKKFLSVGQPKVAH